MKVRFPVFALHGGYLGPDDLRRDMGDPSWVYKYLSGHDPESCEKQIWNHMLDEEPMVLLGYSMGGSTIGHLSTMLPDGMIRGAILYESPLIGVDEVGGDFPVLWIRNDYESTAKREQEFEETRLTWRKNHFMTEAFGKGRHVSWRFGFPPFGHAWDKNLNDVIEYWMELL
jgi:pimeloyl-ACP methyl ester carboxylesterase